MKYITDLPAVQDMAYCLGKEGCLFITLCAIAERIIKAPIDLLRAARECIDLQYLEYVEDNPTAHLKEAFYVRDRNAILAYLTGIPNITTIKTHRLTKKETRPYYIKYARRGSNNEVLSTHFVLPDYNSLYKSFTVQYGVPEDYYIVNIPEHKEVTNGN